MLQSNLPGMCVCTFSIGQWSAVPDYIVLCPGESWSRFHFFAGLPCFLFAKSINAGTAAVQIQLYRWNKWEDWFFFHVVLLFSKTRHAGNIRKYKHYILFLKLMSLLRFGRTMLSFLFLGAGYRLGFCVTLNGTYQALCNFLSFLYC